MEGLQHLQGKLIRQGRHLRNLTSRVRRLEITLSNVNLHITDNTNAIRFLRSLFGLLLSDLNRYLMLYETILSELDHFLDALDNLSINQLSHSVIPPKEMNDLITHVKDVLVTTNSNYELIVSEVHDYYNLPFSTFACKDNRVGVPILKRVFGILTLKPQHLKVCTRKSFLLCISWNLRLFALFKTLILFISTNLF